MNTKKIFLLITFSSLSLYLFSQTKKSLEIIEKKYQDKLDTGYDMYGSTIIYYNQMDSMLNNVYRMAKLKLNTNQASILKAQQLKWLKQRDNYFKTVDKEQNESDLNSIDNKMAKLHEKAAFVNDRILAILKTYQLN
jgi:uncharacterized protein YecT (DUF1311 family)